MTVVNARIFSLLCIMLCASGLPAEEKLLSRNATYRIIGEAHIGLYGDIVWVWPGTNTRPDESGWMNNPLVEATDTGDLLIDGRTDDKGIVHTPGNWDRVGKRINVEMNLPGPSRLSRVVAHLPTDEMCVTQKATLCVKGDDGLWKQIEEISPPAPGRGTLTFTLSNVRTDQVKLVLFCEGPRVGITELEVWGDGPTQSKTRGLIRMPPHLASVRPPQPRNAAESSVLLTKPTASIKLSGTPLTSGEAALLVDGDRRTQIRIDGNPEDQYTDRLVEVEIDLGVDSFIDSVRIWMPGGQGADTGHVHDFMLAVSAGSEGNIWMVPGKRVTNHYWPADDAPKPYVVPINQVNLVGRRVRLTATLAARGALTYRLAMSELEIWGRAIPHAIKTDVKLDQRPIEVVPEPVDLEQMHPKVRWMVEEKIRCVWFTGDVLAKFDGTDRTQAQVVADAGFNVVAMGMRPDRPGETWSAPVSLDGMWWPGVDHAIEPNFDLTEPAACIAPDGRLCCMIRPSYSPVMWQSWSHDGGRSWEPTAFGPFPGYQCGATQTARGAMVFCVRFPCITVYVSHDGGQTWKGTMIDHAAQGPDPAGVLEVEPDVIMITYNTVVPPHRCRSQRLRVTPQGVEPMSEKKGAR